MEPVPPVFEVEVVYALPAQQMSRRVTITAGCTAAQAVQAAGLEPQWCGEGELPRPLSCFGRLIQAETLLSPGDRVEILRQLAADPKDLRRQRAKAAKASARRKKP